MTRTTPPPHVLRGHLLERAGFKPETLSKVSTRYTRHEGVFSVRAYLSSANAAFVRLELGIRTQVDTWLYRQWSEPLGRVDDAVEDVIQFTRVVRHKW